MKFLMMALAIVLIVFGLLSWVTPIPGGTALIAAGLGILICTSEKAAQFLMICRTRFGRLDRIITWIEGRVPARLGQAIRRTRPSTD